MQIPIIDLFAGPGGLGEGFASVVNNQGESVFKIKLSIEKDFYAHRTLELRAFFRTFPLNHKPLDYYEYLKGEISREQLFNKFPIQADKATNEAWLLELGTPNTNDLVDKGIIHAINGEKKWVLIGGPPCQAYSLAGRSRIKGENKLKYEQDTRHFLYREYLRILAFHLPPVFIMENVKGLLSAEVNEQNIFDLILSDLIKPFAAFDSSRSNNSNKLSYKLFAIESRNKQNIEINEPEDYIVHSEKHGIPQARHRLIILGIRSDIFTIPKNLDDLPPVKIEEVIDSLPKIRSMLSKEDDNPSSWKDAISQVINKISQESGFNDQNLLDLIISQTKKVNPSIGTGGKFIKCCAIPEKYPKWFIDDLLDGVCNHQSRSHIKEDLQRYFFASVFSKIYHKSPKIRGFPKSLMPKHKNIDEAVWGSKFNDRFRVQIKGRQATTIVSHINKDGHYYIHYDPLQCRSLTVREAARIQTFPDNYCFEGPQTEQYKQVGNAVPPMLAHQIGMIIAEIFH